MCIRDRGAVFVFENQNGDWQLEQKIEAPAGLDQARFGAGMVFSKGRMVVSAPFADDIQGRIFALDFNESVSVYEDESNNILSLYPNPTNDHLVLELDGQKVREVEILDVLGSKVTSYNYTGKPIDVSELNSGNYVVKITLDDASIVQGRFSKL